MTFFVPGRKSSKPKQRRESRRKSEKYGTKFKLTREHLLYVDWPKAEAYLFVSAKSQNSRKIELVDEDIPKERRESGWIQEPMPLLG